MKTKDSLGYQRQIEMLSEMLKKNDVRAELEILEALIFSLIALYAKEGSQELEMAIGKLPVFYPLRRFIAALTSTSKGSLFIDAVRNRADREWQEKSIDEIEFCKRMVLVSIGHGMVNEVAPICAVILYECLSGRLIKDAI